MICACCGLKIKGEKFGPYNNDQYYCEKCWNNPNLLFFNKPIQFIKDLSDDNFKIESIDDNLIETIDQFRQHSINPPKGIGNIWKEILGDSKIELPVIKANQKEMELFFGKIKAYELLLLSSVNQWTENENDGGYQRSRYRSRNREIKEYLKNCPIPLIPSLLGSVTECKFIPSDDQFGRLEIPVIPGAIALLDGQQRAGGFDELFQEYLDLVHQGKSVVSNSEYVNLLNFDIPIVLINSAEISQKINEKDKILTDLKSCDIERAFFIIINKTQRGVNASLKDELAYRTIRAGIYGVPIIEKERWRAEIVPIANSLNEKDGPLNGLINLAGISGLKRPIQLNGFVTSLKELFVNNENFRKLEFNSKKNFLKIYWNCIRSIFPGGFEENNYSKFLLTKSIGIYVFNRIASDYFTHCIDNGIDPFNPDHIFNYLSPLKEFDWSVETSPLAYLGGKKGVGKGYNIMTEFIKNNL